MYHVILVWFSSGADVLQAEFMPGPEGTGYLRCELATSVCIGIRDVPPTQKKRNTKKPGVALICSRIYPPITQLGVSVKAAVECNREIYIIISAWNIFFLEIGLLSVSSFMLIFMPLCRYFTRKSLKLPEV